MDGYCSDRVWCSRPSRAWGHLFLDIYVWIETDMEILLMGRRKLKPDYDRERVREEIICITKNLYYKGYSYRQIAYELELSVSKVIKLLITGGIYSSDICRKINHLYESGKTLLEIQESLGVSRATVQSYLPYNKGIYNVKELSVSAERIRLYRKRQKVVKRLTSDMSETALWDAVVAFVKYPFHTVQGVSFYYEVIAESEGEYTKGLVIKSGKEQKLLDWSMIWRAFTDVAGLKDKMADRSVLQSAIRWEYVYAIFKRFGIVNCYC